MELRADWHFCNPVRIVAGPLGALAAEVPLARLLLVTSAGFVRRGLVERIEAILPGRIVSVFDQVQPNPDVLDLDAATAQLRRLHVEAVLAMGGGSVIDAAKLLSISLRSPHARPMAEAIASQQLASGNGSRIPVFAVPTTSGTGAEVTPFATLWDRTHKKKHSIAGAHVLPSLAFLAPELTLSLPPKETLYTALDACSHSLESLWNRHRTPVSAAFAHESLSLMVKALPIVLQQPDDLRHRALVQQASVMAGLAISQTRTAVAHAISYPLTSHHDVPHGLACSFTLPTLLETNLDMLVAAGSERNLLKRVLEMLKSLRIQDHISSRIGAHALMQLIGEMHAPGRSENYNGVPIDIPALLERALR